MTKQEIDSLSTLLDLHLNDGRLEPSDGLPIVRIEYIGESSAREFPIQFGPLNPD